MIRIYQVLGGLLLVGYAYTGLTGRELPPPRPEVVTGSVRQSPGGYRSFWHSGFRGGK